MLTLNESDLIYWFLELTFLEIFVSSLWTLKNVTYLSILNPPYLVVFQGNYCCHAIKSGIYARQW